jgi:hypothetical protein
MTAAPLRWLVWQKRVTTAGAAGDDVRKTLLRVAAEVAAACPRGFVPTRRWVSSGVTVKPVGMRGRGRCDVSCPERSIYVNRSDNRQTQQFTVAHEIGHLLLSSLPANRLREMSLREEEDLCDEFAHRVIVPPAELAHKLAGEIPLPEWVLRLCGDFEANPSTMVRALGGQLDLARHAYLLARLRPHYLRPAITGFRVDAAAGPNGLFWPQHQRIEGLGLRALADAAREAPHGAFFEGNDERMVVPLARVDVKTRHNAMVGGVRWQGVRQGRKEPYVLALIDCSGLVSERLEGRDEADRSHILLRRGTVAA